MRRRIVGTIVVLGIISVDCLAIIALTHAVTPGPWMSPPRPPAPSYTGVVVASVLATNVLIGALLISWRFLRQRRMTAAPTKVPDYDIDRSEHAPRIPKDPAPSKPRTDPSPDEPIKRAPQTWTPAPEKRPDPARAPGATPNIHHTALWTCSKDPGMEDSNEDVALFVADGSRAAVFDGATESFAARRWARLVASSWDKNPDDFIGRAQSGYASGTPDRVLSWAQEEASQRGSFTTIAAIQAAPGGLRTTIVGDSCLLFLNEDNIIESFPYSTEEEFGSTPLALSSDATTLGIWMDVLRRSTWLLSVDTSLVTHVMLVTDAIGAWLLVDDPAARTARVRALRDIAAPEQWRDLVHEERAGRRMKTDDSTVILMSIKENT